MPLGEVDVIQHHMQKGAGDDDGGEQTDAYTEERLKALRDFFEITTSWYLQIRKWPMAVMVKFVKLGDKALKTLRLGG